MEKYSKAVSEMYSQFKQREPHPMEKYVGRRARFNRRVMEVVGYQNGPGAWLIVDGSKSGGWTEADPKDVIFKECNGYWYVSIDYLIN